MASEFGKRKVIGNMEEITFPNSLEITYESGEEVVINRESK